MKIRMTQPEIAQILMAHILATVSLKSGSQPTIEFTATRGDEGIVAEVDIPYLGVSAMLGVAQETALTMPAPVVAVPQKRAPRAVAAPSQVNKEANLFANLTQPAAVTEDAAPSDTEVEAASIEAVEAMDVSGAEAEDAPFEVPAADGPKSLFAQ